MRLRAVAILGVLTLTFLVSSCVSNDRNSCLRLLLEQQDFSKAAALVARNPTLLNGEFVEYEGGFGDGERSMVSYRDGVPLLVHFSDKPKVIRWLLERGARIDVLCGGSAIQSMAADGSIDSLKICLKAMKDRGGVIDLYLNWEDGSRKTALFHAVDSEEYGVADLLLKNGVNINHTNSVSKTILDQVLDEIGVIGAGEDFGGQGRVAELRKAEAWIRKHGGKQHIEVAEKWVKETRENERAHRKLHEDANRN